MIVLTKTLSLKVTVVRLKHHVQEEKKKFFDTTHLTTSLIYAEARNADTDR